MAERDGYAKAEWRAALYQSLRQDRYWLPAFVVLYAGAIALVLARRPYSLTLDAVAYLDIAGRVSRGDFRAVINSHWSPLWPGLLSIWFRLFPSGAPAAHVAAAALSGMLLVLVYAALVTTVRDRRLRVFWLAAFAATIFWCASFYLTPDLLQAALVLPLAVTLYLAAVRDSLRLAALAGVWAAVVYLAKCYGFPWSIGASFVIAACPASRRPRAVAAVYLVAFLLSSLPWLFALHAEYGRWMFCHSGRILIPGSGYRALATGQGMDWTAEVLAPPSGQRHVWDDPGRMRQNQDVRWESAWFQQGLLYNLRGLARILWENPAVTLALCCLLTVSRRTSGFAWLCGCLAALWVFGYLLVFLEYRYLLPAMSLSFVAAAPAAERLWRGAGRMRLPMAAIGVTLVSVQIVNAARWASWYRDDFDYDRMLRGAASAIRADNAPGTVAADAPEESMLLAYHADRVSVNVLQPHPPEALAAAARRFNIRYLLWKHPSEEQRRLLRGWSPIWTGHGRPGYWVLFKRW